MLAYVPSTLCTPDEAHAFRQPRFIPKKARKTPPDLPVMDIARIAAALGATPRDRVISMFSGAGGGVQADHLLGHKVVCYVEWEDYCIDVMKARIRDGVMDDAAIWTDARTFDPKPWRGLVDAISAGYPCQPFSVAGRRQAGDDTRNGWPATIRVIEGVRPLHAYLENVPGLLSGGHGYFATVLADLARAGYHLRWDCLPACAVGAPHQRDRLWHVAVDASRSEAPDAHQGKPLARWHPEAGVWVESVEDDLLGGVEDVPHQFIGKFPRAGIMVVEPSPDGVLRAVVRALEPMAPLAKGKKNKAAPLPTPAATTYGSSQNGINGKGGAAERPSACTPSLDTMARRGEWPMLPTPAASSFGHFGGKSVEDTPAYRLSLETMARHGLWPTPHGMGEDGHGNELSQSVRVAEGLSDSERSAARVPLWPTPCASVNRKSARAMTSSEDNGRRFGGGQSSPPGLEQAVELSLGIVPRELIGIALDKLPPSTRALWPTPNAEGGTGYMSGSNRDTWRPTLEGAVQIAPCGPPPAIAAQDVKGMDREEQQRRWRSPDAHEWKNRSYSSQAYLEDQVMQRPHKQIPTPSATDWKGSSRPGQRRGQLTDWLARQQFPTPTAEGGERGRTVPEGSVLRHGNAITPGGVRRQLSLEAAVRQFWPTPCVPNGGRAIPKDAAGQGTLYTEAGRKVQVDLAGAVKRNPYDHTPTMIPTPTVGDSRSSGRHTTTTGVMNPGTTLTDFARKWPDAERIPTPRAEDSESAGAHRGVPDTLTSHVRLFPTPTSSPHGPDFARAARDGSGADDLVTHIAREEQARFESEMGRKANRMRELGCECLPCRECTPEEAASETHLHDEGCPKGEGKGWDDDEETVPASEETFPTPRAANARQCRLEQHDTRAPEASKATPGQLSPDWVETLMGWPVGWTSLEPMDVEEWFAWFVGMTESLAALLGMKPLEPTTCYGMAAWTSGAWEAGVPRVGSAIPCRVQRLKAIGNGQVPLCAALAWITLSRAFNVTKEIRLHAAA